MKKIIIATHHNLAKGFKDTIEYLLPNTIEIIDLNAYIENVSIDNQIEEILNKFEKNEQIFIFTDLNQGSVNQEFIKKMNKYNIELISGVNLPIIMEIALKINNNENISPEIIREEINNASKEIIYVNDKIKENNLDIGDE